MDLTKMSQAKVPFLDWEITDVLDDIIMVQFVDVEEDGFVKRDSLFLKTDPTKQLWRVGKVILSGPECSDRIRPGVHIIFPNDKGIQVPKVGGFENVAFINEERIFGICEPKKAPFHDQLRDYKTQNENENEPERKR